MKQILFFGLTRTSPWLELIKLRISEGRNLVEELASRFNSFPEGDVARLYLQKNNTLRSSPIFDANLSSLNSSLDRCWEALDFSVENLQKTYQRCNKDFRGDKLFRQDVYLLSACKRNA